MVVTAVVFPFFYEVRLHEPLLKVIGALVGFTTAIVTLVVGIVAIPFGPEAVMFSLFLNISAEPTPVGSYESHLLPYDVHDEERHRLMHSAPYEREDCFDIINKWLTRLLP